MIVDGTYSKKVGENRSSTSVGKHLYTSRTSAGRIRKMDGYALGNESFLKQNGP